MLQIVSYGREEKDRGNFVAINTAGSMWCLDENRVDGRVQSKTLLIIILKPEPTEDEVTWRKGESHFLHTCCSECILYPSC